MTAPDAASDREPVAPGAAAGGEGLMAHTPGPWSLDTEDLRGGRYWVVRIPGQETVDIHADDNGEANARLIHAAPDLLAALCSLVDAAEQQAADDGEDDLVTATPEMDPVRAVIAKATGNAP